MGSPIPDDRRAPGSDLGKTFSSPLLRKSFVLLAFFDLVEDFFACGRYSIYGKEGLHKERVPIRAQADYVLCQGNWRKINDLRTIGSTLCIVDLKSEFR